MRIFVLLAVFLICGCTTEEEIKAVNERNKATLAGEPEIIGKLSDDRTVKRFYIEAVRGHGHWVYLVDGSDVTTVNHTVSEQTSDDQTITYIMRLM